MASRRFRFFKVNKKGQSLVQVLVSVAITGVVALAIANIMSQQNRALMIFSEKVARLDLEKLLMSTLANGWTAVKKLESFSFPE